MPQDDLADIKEALLAARRQDGSENPVLYRKSCTPKYEDTLNLLLYVECTLYKK